MDIYARLKDGRSQFFDTEAVGGLKIVVGEPYDFGNDFFDFFVFFYRKSALTTVERAEKIYLNRQLFFPFQMPYSPIQSIIPGIFSFCLLLIHQSTQSR